MDPKFVVSPTKEIITPILLGLRKETESLFVGGWAAVTKFSPLERMGLDSNGSHPILEIMKRLVGPQMDVTSLSAQLGKVCQRSS